MQSGTGVPHDNLCSALLPVWKYIIRTFPGDNIHPMSHNSVNAAFRNCAQSIGNAFHILAIPLIALLVFTWMNNGLAAEPVPIKIGVLSFRTADQTRTQWAPTAEYLNRNIPEYRFEMVPMNYPAMEKAIADKSIDFVLTNTAHYVSLEAAFGITRILTMVVSIDGQPFKEFGGVIFTRSDRSDITTLKDLCGKRFLAVGSNSLGGYLVAWQALEKAGVNPQRDFEKLLFNGLPQDEIVYKVLRREVDAGTVRTHVLENMVQEGKIKLTDLKILNRQNVPGFPYLLSTQLYPEWPLARMPHTEDTVVEKVIVALITMKQGDPAAIAGKYDRWIPPLNYQGVHDLFKELRTGPYQNFGTFTFGDVVQKYQKEIIFLLILMACILLFMAKIIRLNDSLRRALSEVKILRGFLPICSSCKKIRDDSGYWNRIETYIRHHSEAEFSHSICPDCAKKLFDKYNESIKAENNQVTGKEIDEELTSDHSSSVR